MLFRIVRIQPPIEVTRIVSAGRSAWSSTSPTKSTTRPTVSRDVVAALSGSQWSLIANSQIEIRAIQKYGNAEVITKIGGSTLSSSPPRLQAPSEPTSVPRTKASTVVTPTSAERPRQRLQHHLATGVREERERDAEVAASKMLPRYVKYGREQALVGVDAEGDLERVQRLRVEVAPVAGHHRQRRVAGHEARDEEVDRDRRPERDDEEPQPPKRRISRPAPHA